MELKINILMYLTKDNSNVAITKNDGTELAGKIISYTTDDNEPSKITLINMCTHKGELNTIPLTEIASIVKD